MTTRGTAALFGGLAVLVCGLIISGGSAEKQRSAKPRTGRSTTTAPSPREKKIGTVPLTDFREASRELQTPKPPRIEFPTEFTSEPPAGITPQPLAANVPPSKADPELRLMIRQELPDATEQEVGIWTKQLTGMPLSQARDLIRIRRQFRDQDATTNRPRLVPFSAGTTAKQPGAIELPQTTIPRQPLVSQQTERPSDVKARIAPSLKALRQARNVILNNIANANTPGFKRSAVMFGETPSESEDGIGRGVEIVRIDRKTTPIDLQSELAELKKIAEQMKALQEAARLFDSLPDDGFQLQPAPQFPEAKRNGIRPTSGKSSDDDPWWGDWQMSPKAREIERNLGIEH